MLAAIVVVFLVSVIAIQFVNSEPELILPGEYEIRNALRVDESQNGYFDIAAATQLIPQRPAFLMIPSEFNPATNMPYIAELDSIGGIAQIDRPNDDPVLLKYLEDCIPVFDRIRPALDKPHMLLPYPLMLEWGIKKTYTPVDVRPLLSLYTAAIMADFLHTDKPERGASLLKEIHRIENASVLSVKSWLVPKLPITIGIKTIALESDDRHALTILLHALKDAELPYNRPENIIQRWCRILDNTQLFPASEYVPEGGLDLESRFQLIGVKSSAKFIAAEKKSLEALSQLPSIEHRKWLEDNELGRRGSMKSYIADTIISDLSSAYYAQASHYANIIFIAAKLYKLDTGAFPATLDQLQPEYLETIPMCPFTNTPFLFENLGEMITLHGEGYHSMDYWARERTTRKVAFFDHKDFQTDE